MIDEMDTNGPPADLVGTVVYTSKFPHSTACEFERNSGLPRHSKNALYRHRLLALSDKHATMLSLPPEILERIAASAGPRDVLALRSTCKELEAATVNSFVLHFIKRRIHAITIRSVNVLFQIAVHPHFGKFVDTVILDTTFPFTLVNGAVLDAADEPLSYRGFQRLIHIALRHLVKHGKPVILGVTDRNPASVGITELLARPRAHLFTQERNEVFLMLHQYAGAVGLKISGFDIECSEDHGPSRGGMNAQTFADIVGGQFSFLSTSTSLKMMIGSLPGSYDPDLHLIWEPKSQSLDLCGLNKWHGLGGMATRLLHGMVWPSKAMIKDFALCGSNIKNGFDFFKFMDLLHTCLKTLERIRLSDIVIENDSKWSLVLHQLARASRLKQFELDTLIRNINTRINTVSRRASICHVNAWNGSGDNVSAELRNLSAIVKADEDRWESINLEDPRKWAMYTKGRNKHLGKMTKAVLAPLDPDQMEAP